MEKNVSITDITKPLVKANKFCQSLRPFSLYIEVPALYCVINLIATHGVWFLVSQNTYQKLKGPQRLLFASN